MAKLCFLRACLFGGYFLTATCMGDQRMSAAVAEGPPSSGSCAESEEALSSRAPQDAIAKEDQDASVSLVQVVAKPRPSQSQGQADSAAQTIHLGALRPNVSEQPHAAPVLSQPAYYGERTISVLPPNIDNKKLDKLEDKLVDNTGQIRNVSKEVSRFLNSSAGAAVILPEGIHPRRRERFEFTDGFAFHFSFTPESGKDPNIFRRTPLDLAMTDHWCNIDNMLLGTACIILLIMDVIIVRANAHSAYAHFMILVLNLALTFCYCIMVRIGHDWAFTEAWATGYLVEIALSIENMFAIHLVFNAFSVPTNQVTFALTVGIYGALVLRLLFILLLESLFELGYIVDVVVGVMLIFSGIVTVMEESHMDVSELYTTRIFKWFFGDRLQAEYDTKGRCFVTGPNGERRVTMLLLVIWLTGVVDIFFAVDSVGSKTGHIRNSYINISSAVMAVFSLRAAFFVIRDMANYFDTLKYGICMILMLMGLEMLLSKWLVVGLGWMCVMIAVIFAMSILASVVKRRIYGEEHLEAPLEEKPVKSKDAIKNDKDSIMQKKGLVK
mmetsp:Transcript_35650/g.65388  ORF Transcript_35650/g.65388 Transcript_35650/m.65388 type:complete len:554 (+) Transcript_35650:70-1731(+)